MEATKLSEAVIKIEMSLYERGEYGPGFIEKATALLYKRGFVFHADECQCPQDARYGHLWYCGFKAQD